MPQAGKSFVRPWVSQHTTAGHQATELTELASRTLTIDPITVSKQTYGGALRISFQDRDWSSPEILNIVTADLVRQYAEEIEAVAGVNIIANATGTPEVIGATPDAEALVKGIYNAAAKVNTAVGTLPDTIYVSPDKWAQMGSIVDANKRPLFPTLAPSNAGGTASADSFAMNPLGLRLVVSNHLGTGTMIVGSSRYFETYENVGGALSAVDPSVLGVTLAYYGYFAALVTVGGAFVKLTDA